MNTDERSVEGSFGVEYSAISKERENEGEGIVLLIFKSLVSEPKRWW